MTDCSRQSRLPVALLLSILVFTPIVTVAQSGGAPVGDSLTLERCIALARERSPELRIASDAVQTSRLDRQLADQERLPKLRFVGGAGYAPFSHTFGYDPAVSNGGELGAQIAAEQTIYSGGLFGLQAKQAETQTIQHSIEWQQQDRNLVYAVRQAFIDLLAAEQYLDLSDQSVERLSGYADLVTDLSKSGRVGYADVLNARVELARGRIDSSNAAMQVTGARLNLDRLLGLPEDSALTISGSLDNLLFNASDTGAVVPVAATFDNLDVSNAKLGLQQSRLALDMTQSQWKPTVSLTADAGVITSRENLLQPSSERYRSTGYSVGISVEMPLWDSGRRKTEAARNKTEISAAEENLSLVRRDVTADYRETHLRFVNALSRLGGIRDVVHTAEESYLLNKAQYADGYASASDVLLAQQALTDTRKSEFDVLAEIQSLKARLDMLMRTTEEDQP